MRYNPMEEYQIKECDRCHVTKPVRLIKWTNKENEYLCDFCSKFLLNHPQPDEPSEEGE